MENRLINARAANPKGKHAMNRYAHIKYVILDSYRKGFPFSVVTTSGRCLAYFVNRTDAQKYCASL